MFRISLFIVATSLFAAGAALADERASGASNPAGVASAGDQQITVIIAPRTWFLFLEEPDRYFLKAFEHFKQGRNLDSARDVQRAATLLKLEAASADRESRAPLQAAIYNLEMLANEVAAGRTKDETTLSRAFALAHYRMAKFHERQAASKLEENNLFEAGQDLEAASHHLDHGFAWAGAPEAEGIAAAAQRLSATAGQMIAGASTVTVESARQALVGLEQAMRAFGEAIRAEEQKQSP
jgi:hypothetical protein